MDKSKKAAIEVQFNWIFVIIAGAFILLFFISVVARQRSISDERISYTILTNLESALTATKISTDVVDTSIELKKEVRFECNKYYVGNLNLEIKDKAIFSPDVIKKGNLITWTLDWNVPFRVINLLYLTHPEVRYIVVSDRDFADEIYNNWLPDEINKELYTSGPIGDKNNYRVKFVFVNEDPDDNRLANLQRMPDEHVRAIKIVPTPEGNNNYGYVYFYKKSGSSWVAEPAAGDANRDVYLLKESLLGAIFAHDFESYKCGMKNAYLKLGVMEAIHLSRSGFLSSEGSAACNNIHLQAARIFPYEKDDCGDGKLCYVVDYVYDSQLTRLIGLNRQAQLNSCVLIY